MTNDEYELIADVLRHRVNEITKMFEEPDAHVDDVPRAMKVQVLLLAHDLEVAFYQRDPALKENIFVGTVADEMDRNVTKPTEYTLGWASGAPKVGKRDRDRARFVRCWATVDWDLSDYACQFRRSTQHPCNRLIP